ncbi:MAG: phosphopantothenoylcysteine decarboxylase [Acidobacteria bacterium RIFCSPLOWO2_12_FULL_54_10]|nr:MAG: phosphopantothenoylcysteine decarboxylase [Acidobacteria bacterium RIFCSPLOWO2_12_FULL_54_10]
MKIAIGVTGGISAYKAAELVRDLQQRGLEIQVIMTAHAEEFVRPLTFAALTGQKVITQMFGSANEQANVESAIEHIAVAQSIDLLVIAPASADFIAKMAHGLADDFLSTTVLATKAPVIVAPAMNVNMWDHPATQHNIETLRKRGVHIVEPDSGYLACGMTGPGRLASTVAISERVLSVLGIRQDLKSEVVLITAGPTREPIDPVRYISNRSSGKMGYAVAEAAHRRGARVILVSGPASLRPPEGVETVPITTAGEMHDAVLKHLPESTIVIKAAAVADFRPVPAPSKIKKSHQPLTLQLEPTADILAEIGKKKGDRLIVGFAAQTEDLETNALLKLQAKGLDLIVANDVMQSDGGIDSDFNAVTILGRDGYRKQLPRLRKSEVANEILNEVVHLRANGKTRKS